ncbi:AI-2E family transporter [Sphingomonas sp. HDW15A]|uniref:AI-2E family transporter n=1 Tax=Sphingomonas sp. HDW15A TaxID=2714942 RepID=UPI001F0ED357|nr:AI-2E family transporter [Sphingomonas sp. HDW15A]
MTKAKGSATGPEQPGPTEFRDPRLAYEVKRAAIWLGMALAIVGVIVLAQPIMLIIGGLVFAVILDGGTRLLGRVMPAPRGIRLTLVTLAGFGFVAWVFYYAGTTLIAQAETLRMVIMEQANRLLAWAQSMGLVDKGQRFDFSNQVLGGVGRLTSAVGSAIGAVTSLLMVVVIGIFVAIEPKLYDRGVAWMLPLENRASFYEISNRVGFTLRRLMAGRLLGMFVEGIGTWLLLWWAGVPMAALLGLLTGLLAFIPNIGALISGVLMVAVGFSAGVEQGLWAIAIYFIVQNVDGYLIMPYVARKTVDLAPALVLGAQLIFGALFGILGLFLADPIVAAIKTTLQELSRTKSGAKTGANSLAEAEAAQRPAARPSSGRRRARPA